jgi:DNA gyrase subunit B
VVEGDSAAGAVSQVRDEQYQAVLPMQGKPLNAVEASLSKVIAYPLFAALTEALGTGAGSGFELDRARYERVVLLMDADADGIHCGALLLLFFYRMMRPLLDSGHIVMAQAPLATIVLPESGEAMHAHSEQEYRNLGERLRSRGINDFTAVRYRGLAGIDLATIPPPAYTRPHDRYDRSAQSMLRRRWRCLAARRPAWAHRQRRPAASLKIKNALSASSAPVGRFRAQSGQEPISARSFTSRASAALHSVCDLLPPW